MAISMWCLLSMPQRESSYPQSNKAISELVKDLNINYANWVGTHLICFQDNIWFGRRKCKCQSNVPNGTRVSYERLSFQLGYYCHYLCPVLGCCKLPCKFAAPLFRRYSSFLFLLLGRDVLSITTCPALSDDRSVRDERASNTEWQWWIYDLGTRSTNPKSVSAAVEAEKFIQNPLQNPFKGVWTCLTKKKIAFLLHLRHSTTLVSFSVNPLGIVPQYDWCA